MLDAVRTCVLRETREKALDRTGLLILGEELVQLVVQRPDALGDRHVLRDSRQIAAVFLGAVEGLGQPGGQTLPVRRGGTRAENVDEPAREQRAHDFAEPVLPRPGDGLRLQRGLLAQDRRVQLLQGGGRLDAELLDEHLARVLVGLERLRLPATAVEREHELAARTLAHRVLAHELLELADEAGGSAAVELGLHPLLDRRQAKLLEPCCLVLGKLLVRKVRERRAAPQLKRFAHEPGPAIGVRRPCLVHELLEAPSVDRVPLCIERVAGSTGLDDVRPERLAEL